MISEISVHNFKSLEQLKLGLGRITVLIGENGSGKSNILEAIALLGAAVGDKLDNEFLVSRGIRIAEKPLMLSAFPRAPQSGPPNEHVRLSARSNTGKTFSLTLSPLTDRWSTSPRFNVIVSSSSEDKTDNSQTDKISVVSNTEELLKQIKAEVKPTENGFTVSFGPLELEKDVAEQAFAQQLVKVARELLEGQLASGFAEWKRKVDEQEIHCGRFLIYAPENSALRRFEDEGQIQPVGIRGEGLFKMLQSFANADSSEQLSELKHSLELVGWFVDFSIPKNLAPGEHRLRIHDRFLGPDVLFDQRSANEGFLFLIFYFAIFLSNSTPQFFAIDNVDAALNPKLCAELIRRLYSLAVKHDKQVIFTTHNPAILDGLNLSDDEQRLYTVYRNEEGRTKVRRINAPKVRAGEVPVRLSDAFMHGMIGGLPKNF